MCCTGHHTEEETSCVDMETQMKFTMVDRGLENGDWEKRLMWKLKMEISWRQNAEKKKNVTVAVTVFRLTLHNLNSIREGLGLYN